MSKNPESAIYLEEFNFILNNETNTISSNELIDYLTNINSLFKSINHTLNNNYAIGYDQVLIEVTALEKGSFNIKTKVKKILKNDYAKMAAAATFGAIATKIFIGDPSPTYVFNNCDNITITVTNEEILQNPETRKSVSRIARTAVLSPNVDSLSIEHSMPDDTMSRVDIEKDKLELLIVDEKEEKEKTSSVMYGVRLTVVSPVLEVEPAKWRVRFNDRKISAQMTDEDFLKAQDVEDIAFGKGDSITADLETITTTKNDNTPDVKHYIRKVHDYPHYTNKKKDLTLFENQDVE